MSTFLALPNKTASPDVFRKFMIQDLMPGAVSDIVVMAVNVGSFHLLKLVLIGFQDHEEFDTAYITLMNGICAQGYALVSGIPQQKNEFVNLLSRVQVNYFDVPSVSARFTNMSDEQRGILQQMGMRVEASAAGAWVGSPSAYDFARIYQMENFDNSTRVHLGCVSMEGYYAYLSLVRGMILFSLMSRKARLGAHYAHYIANSGSVIKANADNTISLRQFFDTTEVDSFGHDVLGGAQSDTYFQDVPRPVFAPSGPPMSMIRSAMMELTPESIQNVVDRGRFFPYFQGLLLPDKEFCMHVFLRLFTKGLGSSAPKAIANLERARNGYRLLANKTAGIALSHAYLGIEMAQNAQLEIDFVISNGSYAGFVLYGDAFTVFYRGQTVKPVEAKELQGALRQMITQPALLGTIQTLINSKVDKDGRELYKVDVTSSTSSRYLRGVLSSVNWADFSMAEKKDIGTNLNNLRLDMKFAPINQTTLSIFLQFIETGNVALIQPYSAHLDGNFADNSLVAIGLGIFGSRPPSISYGLLKGTTKTFVLPEPGKTDPNLAPNNGVVPYPEMPYKLIDHARAVAQWNGVFSQGKILLPEPPRRKGIKYFTDPTQVSGKVHKEGYISIYEQIKRMSKAVRGVDSVTGKKRKIGSVPEIVKRPRINPDEDMEI